MTTPAALQAGANGLSNDAYSPAVETDKPLSGCLILLPRPLGCLSAGKQITINSVPQRIIENKPSFSVPSGLIAHTLQQAGMTKYARGRTDIPALQDTACTNAMRRSH